MDFPRPHGPFQRIRHRGDFRILCEAIMITEVECANPDESTASAARRMRRRDVSFMPVCDKTGRVLGSVTQRDIVTRLVADGLSVDTKVADIMSREAICCGAQDDVAHAHELMARSHKSNIICVDEAGRLEGVISLSDLAQLGGTTERPAEQAIRNLSRPAPG